MSLTDESHVMRRTLSYTFGCFGLSLSALIVPLYGALAQTSSNGSSNGPAQNLPQVDVIATSPLAGAGVDRDKIPALAQGVRADEIARTASPSVIDSLSRSVPGIALSDVQGNGFSQDLFYRGFNASSLQGRNQGLAVYQNGVRLNEAFGDTVNWDFIPPQAIQRMDVWTNNPLFGLNALGGAINLQMKSGFDWQGFETQVMGGSYGRIGASFQYGLQKDNYSLYVASDAMRENGWRKFSPSNLFRLYSDLGWRNESSEFHLAASGASNRLGVIGPTPIETLASSYSSVYTTPQSTINENGSVSLTGKFNLSPLWTVQTQAYLRRFVQSHQDGNSADFEQCSSRSSYLGFLCLQDDPWGTPVGGKTTAWRNQFVLLDANGKTIPFAGATVPYGVIDSTASRTTSVGASAQATYTGQIAGHDNYLSFGASLDHSQIDFQSRSVLGFIFPDLRVGTEASIAGLGQTLHTAGSLGYAPVSLNAKTDYFGLYGIDTFNITPQLAVTAGGRLNLAQLKMNDVTGLAPELNGSYTFTRFNPMIGLAYKLPRETTIYAGYSEANRIPTPLELNCADPLRPCLLENSLVADPPLKQVVSKTLEAGLRGNVMIGSADLDWKLGVFRTDSSNDILPQASVLQGRGYYANIPLMRRQGVEAGVNYQWKDWQASLNYAFIDATYQFNGTFASPNHPRADANGNIQIVKGSHIPSIPAQQIKLSADYALSAQWKLGATISAVSSQYYNGDDSNQNAKLPAYWVAGLQTSYQLTKTAQIFGQVNNLFNRKFGVYGTYFEKNGVSLAQPVVYTDARMLTPLQPFSVYGGLKMTF